MLFEHRPWSPWDIEVLAFEEIDRHPEEIFEGIYRSSIQECMECEQFSLISKEFDTCLVQIRIFKNGELTIESHPSTFIRVNRRKKRITIHCDDPGDQSSPMSNDLLVRGKWIR